MGSQNPTSSDRIRTSWTKKMERYFIDLMLDQLHWGNRVGHTFNKQAWADMLTRFNAKFYCNYGVDTLQSHYSVLWKQFNDVKNLLEQNLFSWDDARTMVVADAHVWDSYIKAKPDAQMYRNKILVNFNDLCLIYAYTKADGRYSRSSHDIDLDDDFQVPSAGTEKIGHTSMRSNIAKACWTQPMDCYLTDLLLDQALRGKKIGHTFETEAWTEMVRMFNNKFGAHYDSEDLKKRYKYLRGQYKDIEAILEQSGFHWDDAQKMVTAEDYVWDSYIKEYPEAQSYVDKSLPSYHKLCVIYGQEVSNGNCDSSGHHANFDSSPDLMFGEDLLSHPNSDKLMVWTPPMDRYLIDLMSEQVRKGNRVDSAFNNEAWMDITMLFEERFGLLFNKGYLRSRHKTLEKLYDQMTNLLHHRGLSSDENQQTVSVYDDVWDAYIQPDAKSYRTQFNRKYDDLCLIYGNSRVRDYKAATSITQNGDGTKLNNGYCQRIDWAPSVDRYFIDLMLDQVRQGNVRNQKFSKQAWTDIVAKFGAEFGPQQDKEGLESRFMSFKKKFRDMKKLLDHGGFAWDETRQMVTADDSLWDDYVMEHPDAQCYRDRTLPNYNDLFLIYGDATGKGTENHSHDSMVYFKYYPRLKTGDKSSTIGDPLRIQWTRTMEKYFIDLLLEQVYRGNKIGHTFSKEGWAWITTSFSEKFGPVSSRDALESKYLRLMKKYCDITDLNRNGFGCDETYQRALVGEDLWDAGAKEFPGTITFEDGSFNTYKDLSIIFGDRYPVRTSSSVVLEMDIDYNASAMGVDGIFGDMEFPASNYTLTRKEKRKYAPSIISTCRRRVHRLDREIPETPDEKKIMGYEENADFNSIEIIVDALQAIPGMNDEIFLDACKLLENERRVKKFVAMDVGQRRKWLKRKLQQ